MSEKNKGKPLSIKELKREGRKATQMADSNFTVEDIYEKCSKLTKKMKTGIVFDEKFATHDCIWDPNYPENPKRYTCVIDRLSEYKLIGRCEKIPNRNATREEICTQHDSKQVDILESTAKMTDVNELEKLASQYDSVYFNQNTNMASQLAVGSVLNLVEAVALDQVQNGMAVVRPPGHHAMKAEFCGYCFYNNVAIAAKYALDKLNFKKILIVDWDVHHGQATQQMFFEDDRVLYFSIHRYEHGEFWPNLRESNFDYVGKGKGYGYNINIPLNETGCGDADYLTIFHSVLLPVAYEFCPDLILVSAGYDAAIGCTEGQMLVSPGCYHHLTTSLMGLAEGKVVVCLEGGYFLPSLAESAAQTMKALLGDTSPRISSLLKPKHSVLSSIYNVISILRTKWNCFNNFNDDKLIEDEDTKKHIVEVLYIGYELKPPFETRNCYPVHAEELRKQFNDEIDRLRNNFYKEQRLSKVGYIYDKVMEFHVSPDMNSFEKPERLTRTLNILEELDLLDRLIFIKSREATNEEIETCHDEKYLNKIESLGSKSESSLKASEGWSTVFTSTSTMQSARVAAGSILQLLDALNSGEVTCGVALVRPPGHHAEQATACGFCILNNVSIAAKYALKKNIARRILIVDWDIHHGNGIQKMFYDNPNVLYLSVHRYENGKFFPHSNEAEPTKTGSGPGTGFTINLAWNNGIMSDSEYISCWIRVILPIAYEFDPDLVLVAAGFDACRGDPLGGYSVTPEAYGHLVQLLKPLAGGKIVIALEGGYNINSVAYSMAMCVKSLLNDPLPLLNITKLNNSAQKSIEETVKIHQNRWKLLLPKITLENSSQ